MKTDYTGSMAARYVLGGFAVMFLTSILLAVIAGALICSGAIPSRWMRITAFAVTLMAVFTGAFVCARNMPRCKLPGSVASAVLYLVAAYLLRHCLSFDDAAQIRGIVICAGAAALAGAVLSGSGKRR